MSHEIYTTDALVLSSYQKGETASVLALFTKDFGLVYAHADGLRKMESKLRPALQNHSYAQVSLVRGREVWRVVNAQEKDYLSGVRADSGKRSVFVQTLALIKRFLGQEEPHTELFNDTVLAFEFLNALPLKKEELSRFELLLVLRILSSLGYLKEDLETRHESIPFKSVLGFSRWERENLDSLLGKEKECILAVNESFQASGL
ncbi:hypothetical protein CL654_03160 [bacterium]|nr:hypothetical protein [bacterium]|tara:strand:+ start:19433 stop:20044 length:612 start_codon:yes stop_codon:yes gene_type:complete